MKKCICNSKGKVTSEMVPIIAFQVALCAVVLEAYNDVATMEGRVCDYLIFDPECPQLEYPFRISWHKGNTSSQRWMQGNTGHGQRVRVFPNGTLGLRVVGKEDAGWYTAMVCNSSQHCPYQRKFQLRVRGHLVRGLVGDCVTFDLNCLESAGGIHVIWKKGNQRVAKIRQAANAPVIYCERAHVFPNGSLSRCPAQWGDEGEYVAEVFDQGGVHLHQETFNLELNRVESFKEITEIAGGSVFLNLTGTKLKHFFQVVWKKENTEIAWTNGSCVWYHEEYVNRSEIVSNYSLRLDRIQERDHGRYSIEVNDRDGRTVYEGITNVKVEQKEAFRRILVHVLFYILIASVGVVFITILVALIWHFQKHKDRSALNSSHPNEGKMGMRIQVPAAMHKVQILIPSIHHASLILADEGDNPEKCEEGYENSPCSGVTLPHPSRSPKTPEEKKACMEESEAEPRRMTQCQLYNLENDENPSVQGLDGTNSTEQRSKGLLRSNKKAINPAAADKVPHFSGSTFQDGERGKLPRHGGMKAVKPPALVNEMCVTPNAKNTTHPEFEHSIPPVFDGCAPAELTSCSPPGSEGLKDNYVILCNSDCVPSGSIQSWKCSEGDMPSQHALMDSSKRGLPEDKSGDSVCSSFHSFSQERCPQYWT